MVVVVATEQNCHKVLVRLVVVRPRAHAKSEPVGATTGIQQRVQSTQRQAATTDSKEEEEEDGDETLVVVAVAASQSKRSLAVVDWQHQHSVLAMA